MILFALVFPGIDAEASSIILGNVKCFGTENRGGNLSNGQPSMNNVPIMQFANSDIEDLKIVDEEHQSTDGSGKKQPATSQPAPTPASQAKQASIHDDPAIVSAVMSSSKKDSSMSSRLLHDLHHLNLSDEQSKNFSKKEGKCTFNHTSVHQSYLCLFVYRLESRVRTDSGELGPSWSLLSPSKWTTHHSSIQAQQQPSGNKSKFFDDFTFNAGESSSSHRPQQQQQRWPSNNHSTQTSHRQYQHQNDDDSGLPVRQPFFSDEQSYPSQQTRPQNGHQQRNFYNNRRPQQRRPGGGNRETFYDNRNPYEDEFDFETSNRKFNKLSSEDEFKQQPDSTNQFLQPSMDDDLTADFKPLYDKKKSFFDNITAQETSDLPVPMYHRSRNQDTFGNSGNDRFQRQKYRGGGEGGYRRSNNQNYRQQQGNGDFNYRQQYDNNQNGYHYRY